MARYFNDDGRTVGAGTWVVLDRETGETLYEVHPAFDLPTAQQLTQAIADHLNHGEMTPEQVRNASWEW